jgi:hypothetical protein
MNDRPLTVEEEAEAQRLAEILGHAFQDEMLRLARLLASKQDAELLGKTEFEVRDRVHDLGAKVLETALQERKKRGIKGRASPARTVRKQPGS